MPRLLPSQVLRDADRPVRVLPVCEHIAGRERFMVKALALQEASSVPFDVTLDLEDGAPAGKESEHATMVVDLLRTLHPSRPHRVGVRVHDIRHPSLREDLDLILHAAGDRVQYIVQPKAKNRGDVEYLSSILQDIANDTSRHAAWPIHILIETQRALHDVYSLAAHPDVETLDFGSMDFVSDHAGALAMDCLHSPLQFEHALLRNAKTRLVAAALLNGVIPSHNVTVEVSDPEQAGRDAARARREFGFLRMWSIHPDQIQPIVSALSPPVEEVDQAIEILGAAQDHDWAPLEIGGRLHDRASYRYFWTILRRAAMSGVALESSVRQRFGLGD
ncbi:MAG: CoA ester lyase [Myxococcales bacterium]|nr:CoA ester lyase [Myxococcales bacterium]